VYSSPNIRGEQVKDEMGRGFGKHGEDKGSRNNIGGRDQLGDMDADGKVILKFVLKKLGLKLWTGFSGICIRSSGGFF
jgi:hypothetical protein